MNLQAYKHYSERVREILSRSDVDLGDGEFYKVETALEEVSEYLRKMKILAVFEKQDRYKL